ncbi:DUF1345 domain-containing protein [Actinomyces wuliandei]|uniref:DUF1345 domain-containing protein n=1 Tax=Actinomyces wuliandei TaxID=2057743 RepID=UPI000FD83B66|nr:DUF1345 domain-containing protein [Actinomyces wuliandei]
MATARSWRRYLLLAWDMVVTVTLIVLSALFLTVSSSTPNIFLAWQVVAVVFIVSSFAIPRTEYWMGRRWRPGWACLLPVLAGLVGVQSAVWALIFRSFTDYNLASVVVIGLSATGVLLSWLLVHIGFAEIYALIDRRGGTPDFAFPGEEDHTSLKYIYLSVTIGTSFAVSDVTALTRRARTAVVLHSVISFVYNALVVAVAFQVLQSLVADA